MCRYIMTEDVTLVEGVCGALELDYLPVRRDVFIIAQNWRGFSIFWRKF